MGGPWKILLYRTVQSESPVKAFIDRLELKAQTKVYNTINLIRDFGTRVGSSHIKKLTGTELWEPRILGEDSIRILYIAITGKTFLLLHGFKKKKDKTPPNEIKIALARLIDHKSRV